MPKLRGIEISVVSQFGIKRMPEYAARTSLVTGDPVMTVCYIPVYPGSQIWFEYSVDGPHPPKAKYFFKLFNNGKSITSWDCTAKHGYHGKTAYSLHQSTESTEGFAHMVQRSAFQFSNLNQEDDDGLMQPNKDCIEIRVHRIEHRQRIRSNYNIKDAAQFGQGFKGKLHLKPGGTLDPGIPQRRYKYQLLDAIDEPFATIRFLYRDYKWLQKNDLLATTWSDDSYTSSSSSSPSVVWRDPDSYPVRTELMRHESFSSDEDGPSTHPTPSPILSGDLSTSDNEFFDINTLGSLSPSPRSAKGKGAEIYLPLDDTGKSLSIVVEDSIEDLPTHMPRALSSIGPLRSGLRKDDQVTARSVERTPHNQKYTAIDPMLPSDVHIKKRPLSPFTSGGLLRNILRSTSPSGPTGVLQHGTVEEPGADFKAFKTTIDVGTDGPMASRASRSGTALMRFLGRRTE